MRTAFAAAFASLFALHASATPGLTLTLDPANADPHIVKATVTNTGSESLKILKTPNSVLSDTETEKFTLTGANGSPAFRGIRVKYSPGMAVKENDPASFIELAPGQSHEVEHDLSKAYDFSKASVGEYKIDALNVLTYVDASGQLGSIKATVQPAVFAITGNNLPPRDFRPRGSNLSVRQNERFIGCSPSQQADISAAIPAAEAYIADALTYLRGNPDGSRYHSWFGSSDSNRLDTVKGHFEKIRGKSGTTTYDCSTCPTQNKPNVFAYVFANQPGKVYLCPAFWRAPAVGTDSKAGTLVHEQSHFDAYGGTRDYAYGQPECHDLATSYPDTAVMNADNHEYFAENTPAQA